MTMIMRAFQVAVIAVLLTYVSCDKEDPVEISVDFTASDTDIVEGQTITFTDMSSNNPTAWEWDFEGGTPGSSAAQNPTITYDIPGTYSVALVASIGDNFGSGSKTDYITVLQKLAAQIIYSDSVILEGEGIDFQDNSEGIPDSWEWSFEGGTPATSTEANPTVIYNDPGVYGVSLAITNEYDESEIILEDVIFVIPTSGLVAYYPFNGNADDESGNGIDGQLGDGNGNAEPSNSNDRHDQENKAYDFDGASYIDLGLNSSLDLGSYNSYAISLWIKPTQTDLATVMSRYSSGSDERFWELNIKNNLQAFRVYDNGGTSGIDIVEIHILEGWQHVTVVLDNSEYKMYLNGREERRLTKNANMLSTSSSVTTVIGAVYFDNTPYDHKYSGGIDDIRIFDRALSPDEVTALFKE